MTKRDDLQGLRGVAILLVLLFHLNPVLFPFGFIGVDMFFVLSGFLITMILSQKKLSAGTLCEFYGRRFKRIVPLFVAILTGVYIVSYFLLILSDRLQFLLDLKWSLAFVSNLQPLYEVTGYWDQVKEHRFLVHCWSLGVEIQFYIIAPFIIRAALSKKANIIFLLFLLLSSFIFQLCSTPKMAYGLPFSRNWQFLCGTIAYELTMRGRYIFTNGTMDSNNIDCKVFFENEKSFSHSKQQKLCIPILHDVSITLLVLTVIWTPSFLDQTSMRIFGTLCTALIIILSKPSNSSLICSKWLVFIGNVSYTLYLVHWPVIVFIKYHYNIKELGYFGTILSLVVMFGVSIVIHYLIEQPLIKADYLVGWIVIIISLLFTLLTLPYYIKEDTIPLGVIANAIKFNEFENSKDYFKLPCGPDVDTANWTKFKEEPQLRCQTTGNGTLNILVLGNSIAYRAFPMLLQLLKGRYSALRLYSRSACPPLSNYCPSFTAAAHIVVEKMKPDIIFLIETATESNFTAPVTNWTTDQTFHQFQDNLNFYSNLTKKIIIDLPYFIYQKQRIAAEIVKRLKLGQSLLDMQVTKEDASVQQYWHRKRLERLKCSKCEINDLDEVLFDTNGVHYFYNRSNLFAYTSDGCHFTPEGLERIKPKYEKIVERIYNKT